ncbi:MAG: hypothetical protein AVDCRST_MAG12-1334, partial [uncultured Rubrobacteraceae bacterium]
AEDRAATAGGGGRRCPRPAERRRPGVAARPCARHRRDGHRGDGGHGAAAFAGGVRRGVPGGDRRHDVRRGRGRAPHPRFERCGDGRRRGGLDVEEGPNPSTPLVLHGPLRQPREDHAVPPSPRDPSPSPTVPRRECHVAVL